MAELTEDLRFATRLLRKTPGFTATALLTLALAIGANTAIFSVVNQVLLRPLPFPESERLFRVVRNDPNGFTLFLSVPQYAFLSEQPQPFSRMAAYRSTLSGFTFIDGDLLEHLPGARVTQSFFEVLGFSPVLGRGFLPEEDVPGGPRVVVLSHELWQRHFGGSRDIVGRSITLNRELYTIVGVAPPALQFPEDAQLWTPLQLDLASTEDSHYLAVLGRLKPGVEPTQVSPLLATQSEQLRALRQASLRPAHTLDARELQSLQTQSTRPALLVLLGAVMLVLLIACVNLANLQLARAASRERELAVRTALGATPPRIVRQLLSESILLAGMGGLLGLLLAIGSVPALLALAPGSASLPKTVSLDGTVLAFTLGLSVLTGLLFGLLPAWQASRVAPQGSLHVSAWRATPGPLQRRTRWWLVVSEVALAILLLIGAALLVKSFALLQRVEPGIDPRNVLTLKLSLSEVPYGNPETLESFVRRAEERLRTLPGAEAAGFALTLPFEGGIRLAFAHEDRPPEDPLSEAKVILYRPVTRGYFEALKIGLVRGRLLDDQDRHGGPSVVVINESAARRFWPGEDPLGKRLRIGARIPQLADVEAREVIGIVRDVHEETLENEPPPIFYIPIGQMAPLLHTRSIRLRPQSFLVRTSEDPLLSAAAVQREIRVVDPLLLATNFSTMEELVSRSFGLQRFSTLLMGLLAGLALLLAAVGIYGVLSYLVNQRLQELSVRLALGATPGQVVWLVLRQGMVPVVMGVAVGVAGALGLSRLLSHLLYSVSTLDPAAFVLAPLVLVGVALVAMLPPAWRASRVNPMAALRTE
jgi:putative ABC transport system permease protein